MMKILKRILAGAFCVLFVFLSGSASRHQKIKTKPEKEDQKEEIPYDYDLSEYLLLGDIFSIQAAFEDPSVCTDKEVDAAVFQILLRHATFEEKSGAAERYNKVRIDFSIMWNGKTMEDYSKSDYELVIGMETDNPMETLLGETLMGARVGETRSVEYRYPDAVIEEELTGKTVKLFATVKAVYQQTIPELIDTFVQTLEGHELNTVQELRESVRGDILEEKEYARIEAVWLALLKDAKVLSYPEKELSDYMAVYRSYYEEMAAGFEVSFPDFISIYMELSEEEFSLQARAFAEEKVKNDMIFTQLVRLQEIELNDEEYQEGAYRYFEKEEKEFSSFEEFEKYYTKERLFQNLIWDKALLTVAQNAHRLETN